jgi:2-polyprenyl-3-methyl-5-hydroxy-6-metoxy-1,4-benzoquinol methylase
MAAALEHLAAGRPEVIGDDLMATAPQLDAIPGDYQYRAITDGFAIQRYWHLAKLRLVDAVMRPNQDDVVLDVGCGSGVVADHIAATGAQVTGLDGNPRAIEFASRTFQRPNLQFELAAVEEAALPKASFSWIVCLELLEHMDDAAVTNLLKRLHRALRPGGRMLITTPNYRGTWPLVEWAADRSGKVAHLAGDQHVNRFDRAKLGRSLRAAGFRVERRGTYCTFAPFAAPLSRRLADAIFGAELRANLPFGNLLYVVAART